MHITTKSNLPPVLENPNGENIQELLGNRAGGLPGHSLALITITQGNASKPHYHKISEESYFILKGEAIMKVNEQTFSLKQGDAILIEPPEVHQISNHKEEDLVFLAVCVPAWYPEDSFEVSKDQFA